MLGAHLQIVVCCELVLNKLFVDCRAIKEHMPLNSDRLIEIWTQLKMSVVKSDNVVFCCKMLFRCGVIW